MTIRSTNPAMFKSTVYPVPLAPEDRADLERLYRATAGVSRTTILRALLRLAMAQALERPEALGPHILRYHRPVHDDVDEVLAGRDDDIITCVNELGVDGAVRCIVEEWDLSQPGGEKAYLSADDVKAYVTMVADTQGLRALA